MKKIIQKEASFCDECEEQIYVDSCLGCGIEHCQECREKMGVKYRHGVHTSGSGDGYYCKACDLKLSNSRVDPLHNAYLAIKNLRAEEKAWWLSFNSRSEHAEKFIEQLRI